MGIIGKLEDIFASAAFAEAGEHDKAREVLKNPVVEDPDEELSGTPSYMSPEED